MTAIIGLAVVFIGVVMWIVANPIGPFVTGIGCILCATGAVVVSTQRRQRKR